MGKRKERRLAAKMAVGRRVKLDLLPEPLGDLGGSPAYEAGGEVESKLDGSLPGSPSSSGEQPVNPLLLLGQYSDVELQDDLMGKNRDLDCNFAVDDELFKHGSDEEQREVGTINDKEDSGCKDYVLSVNADTASGGPVQVAESNVPVESDVVASPHSRQQNRNIMQDSVQVASYLHAEVDVKSCWKMVIHEDSNSYYYWNTATGETSWEMPAEVAQVTAYEGKNNQLTGKNEVGLGDALARTHTPARYDSPPQVTQIADGRGAEGQMIGNLGVGGGPDQDNATLVNYSSFNPSDLPVGGSSSSANVSTLDGFESVIGNQDSSTYDLPSQLLKQSESLLKKLKSLGGSKFNSNQQHAWASKYISEIEIRLSDFKSLLAFGSTLAPFWEHSQRQLRQLEDAVNSEIGSYVESELEKMPYVKEVREAVQEVREAVQEVEREESQVDSGLEDTIGSLNVKCDFLTDDKKMFADVLPEDLEVRSSDMIIYPKQVLVQAEEQSKPETTALQFTPNHGLDAQEDVDMDVDMEVEDTSLPSNNNIHVSKDRLNHVSPLELMKAYPVDHQTSMSYATTVYPHEKGEWVPPLPPDDEEIPPPPPDDEEIPPPPPDEPPPLLPPSYPESMHDVSYSGNYTPTYHDPSYSFYLQHEQAVMAGQTMCYQAVTTSQANKISGPENSIASAILVAAQSSGYHVSPVVSSYVPVCSEQFETSDQSAMMSYSKVNLSGSLLDIGAETGTSKASSICYNVTAPATTNFSVSHSTRTAPAGASSTVDNAKAEAAATAIKPQHKVSRVKRKSVTVASSMRSNKKVSSMVDKWIAAKEELEEADEEESCSAVDLLEKKRRREIEEWRAQQIASGEARGNANFQPLGGDWRERVKRRRAENSAVTASSKEEETCRGKLKQQLDLSELSSGLPHGWQVFWDELSSQVYYGNAITSETTWIRPTQ